MSYLILRLKKKLIFRLDLGEIVPDKLKNKKKNVKNLKIFYQMIVKSSLILTLFQVLAYQKKKTF